MNSSRFFYTLAAASFLSLPALLLAQAPSITATKSDGTPAATKVLPGSTVTYTNTITNSGIGAATGVQFTDPDMAGAVVQNGTLRVSPVAFDDSYTGIVYANTRIDTNQTTEYSVTSNDFPGMNAGVAATFTITAFDALSLNGGAVTMVTSGADMGKFTYAPAPGYTGPDSFTYTITNNGSLSGAGTVSLTVSGPVVWYVNSATGSDVTGLGTLYSPFASVNKVSTVDAANQRVFVAAGTYAGTQFTMKANEMLIGQGVVAASFDAFVLGGTPGADTVDARPAINGTKPTITRNLGNTIILANGNTIVGCAIANSGVGYAVIGTSVTSLLIGNTTAGLAAADTTVTSSGTSLGCLSLTGAATGTVNVTGQITSTAGRSLLINNRSGGTVSIIGKVVDTGSGILLDANTGATFNLRCLTLNTFANTALSATGGGTVNATNGNSDAIDNDGDGSTDEVDEANTLFTTTGTALNVVNTSIGASGLSFRSINSTTASGNPAINLNTTGTSGGLTVTGTGGAGTGGTISGKTVSGIVLNSTAHLTLNQMNITGNGDAIDENGIRATNLFGTCSLSSMSVTIYREWSDSIISSAPAR